MKILSPSFLTGCPIRRAGSRWLEILLPLCCLVARPVQAWNAEGHMAVAQLAYNHLYPAVKARCDALIAVPLTYASSATNTFVTAACWADDFKSQLGTGTSHYIDLPVSLDGTPFAGFVPEPSDVVQAIGQCLAILQRGSATQAEQAACLRYLIHFLGDIQQPLHCSTAFFAAQPNGDAGGNGFRITGTWSNLHSLWDAGGGYLTDSLPRPLSVASQTILNNKVAAVEAAHPWQRGDGALPDVMGWALEARDLAVSVCYSNITRNAAPSGTYLQLARLTTEARMALGGQRLANMLNRLFSPRLKLFQPANGDFGLSWDAVPGTVYHLEWTEDPASSNWNPLLDVIASGPAACFQEAPVKGRRFYRLRQ